MSITDHMNQQSKSNIGYDIDSDNSYTTYMLWPRINGCYGLQMHDGPAYCMVFVDMIIVIIIIATYDERE